ncbi:PREDICTED: nucleoporin NDC1-like isoform X2 [Priapulus caudatus]|uniref:Nucleoporin NDC1-like isoform X2 n=1 Tax=Priapulus caudatus TaxID=37621 RepID=A0ABM1DTP3_PRICU|nr:PREDICTED: nucleoporin NDC1-like isoform X2 [Priapulus caudatus]
MQPVQSGIMLPSLQQWFVSQVFSWRAGASVVWSLILLPALFFGFTLIAGFYPIHLITWITDWLWQMLSLMTWFHLFLIGITTAVIASLNSSYYAVVPTFYRTRLLTIGSMLHGRKIAHALGHAFAAALITWLFMRGLPKEYHNLTSICLIEGVNKEILCLNERYFFVVLHALFVGAIYSVVYFKCGNNCISFPIIQQTKFFKVKSFIVPVFIASSISAARRLGYYYILYFLFGGYLKTLLLSALGVQHSDVISFSSLWGMLDLSLLVTTWASGTLVLCTWNLALHIFKVYVTEPFQFPVESSFHDDRNRCLHQALSATHPLVKYLGFLDLWMLSQQSPKRRREIFSLSQPGGHPHNWNYVQTECMTVIEHHVNKLTLFNESRSQSYGSDRASNYTTADHHAAKDSLKCQLMSPASQGQGIPRAATPYRAKSASPGQAGKYDWPYRYYNSHGTLVTGSVPVYKTWLHYKVYQIVEDFRRRPAVAYFISDLPETKTLEILCETQLCVWSIEALSHLVAASYGEDEYGVVQKDLSGIVSSLLELQAALDKHVKVMAPLQRRPSRSSAGYVDGSQRLVVLCSALKSSIYRIVTTFHSNLGGLVLIPEHRRKLQLFCDYKE